MSNRPQNSGVYSTIQHSQNSEDVRLEQRALLQAIPDMVFVMSPEGTYLDFKLDKEHQLIEDLIGCNVCDLSFMPLTVAQAILKKLEQTILTGQTQSLEYQLEGKVKHGRQMAYYEARFSSIDADKVLMVVRDVSQQKQLENELREVAKKNQQQTKELELLEQVRTLIGNKTELGLLMRTITQAAADVLGYELIALSLLRGEFLEIQHLIGYSQVLPKFPAYEGVEGRVLQSGNAELIKDVKQDPDYFEVEPNTLSEICVPLFVKSQVAGVLIVESVRRTLQENDLRILKKLGAYVSLALEQAELYQELQTSEIRYRELIENANDIIYRTDLSGKFTYSNQVVSRLLGYSENEVLGKHYLSLIRPDYHAKAQAFYLQQFRSKEPTSYFEFPALSLEGEEVWLGQNVQLVWEKQKLVGMQAVARDVTQRKHMEEALIKQAQELSSVNADLQQFAYVAAHDLQEPLRKIQAFGDRLNRKYKDVLDEQGQDYLSRIHASAKRMRTLIDDLLLFSKTTKHEPSLVSLDQIAKEVISDLQSRLEETQGHIEVGVLPTLRAEPIQMRQVLQNLLGNALKFHRPGFPPVVKLMGQRMGSHWQIYVQDNGIGFDQQYKDRIFKVFQRLHSFEKYEGTGMGLAIVRKIVESYNGSIDVFSRPGEGSTFILNFPIESNSKNPLPINKNLEVLV